MLFVFYRPRMISLMLALALAAAPPTDVFGDGLEVATVDHPEPVDFAKEILPILRKKCLACHNASDAESDLVLETPETMLKGGFEGPALVPGEPSQSPLFLLASHQQEPIMPPEDNAADAAPLTAQELGLLKLWIEQGGKGSLGDAANQVEWQRLAANINPVYAAAQSIDGRLLAVGRARQIWMYDLPRGEPLGQLNDPQLAEQPFAAGRPLAHLDLVQSIAFGPQGQWIASGGYRTVKLWQRQPALSEKQTLTTASLVSYSYDDGSIRVIRDNGAIESAAPGGEAQTTQLADASTPLLAAVSLPAGKSMVAVDQSQRLIVCKDDGQCVQAMAIDAPVGQLVALGQTGVIGRISDHQLRMWTLQADGTLDAGRELTFDGAPITRIAAWDDSHLVVSDAQGNVRLCDLSGDQPQVVQQVGHGSELKQFVGHAASGRLVTVGVDGTTKLWQLDQAKHLADLTYHATHELHAKQMLLTAQIAKRHVDNAKADLEAAQKRAKDEEENLNKTKEALAKAEEEFSAAEKTLAEATEQAAAAEHEVAAAKEALAAKEAELANAADGEPKQMAEQAVNQAKEAVAKAEEQRKGKQEAVANAQKPRDEKAQSLDSAKRSVETSTETLAVAQAEAKSLEPVLAAAETAQQQAQAGSDEAEKQRAASPYATHLAMFANHGDDSGATVLTIDAHGLIARWDAASGKLLGTIPTEEPAIIGWVQTSPNTVALLTDGGQRTVHLAPSWELARVIGAPNDSSPLADRVTALAFSPDGQYLAVGGGEPSRSGELKLFRTEDGTLVREFTDAHSDTVFTVAFSHDGKRLASGAADRFMKAFDVQTGELIRTFEGHTHHVLSVGWRADGRVLVTGGADQVVKLWNVQDGSQIRTIQGFGKEVTAVSFAGSTDAFYATCGDQNLYRCDMGGDRKSVGRGDDFLYVVSLNLMGDQIAYAGHDSIVRVIDGDGKQVVELKQPSE